MPYPPPILNCVTWQFNVWDTVNTGLSSNEDYSPTVPGEYTWPLEGTTGYYGAIIAGPSPPLECVSGVPAGTTLVGCFNDSIADRLLGSAELVLNTRGPGGMTAQVIYVISGVGEKSRLHLYRGIVDSNSCRWMPGMLNVCVDNCCVRG